MSGLSLIIGGGLTYVRNPLSEILPAVIGLLISSAFLVIGLTRGVHVRMDESATKLDDTAEDIKKKLDDAANRIETSVECRFLGPGRDVLTEVLTRLNRAQSVRNTFVLFGVPESDAYTKSQFEEVNKKITEFLKKGGSWTDIVSQDVVNSPTMSWLQFLRDLNQQARADTGRDEEERAKAWAALERYRVKHLKGIYPLINFMIVQGEEGKRKEVIFGWGHHSADADGPVFLSRNVDLVTAFDKYWTILERDSVIVEPHSRPITPAEITGLWFRVSYLGDAVPEGGVGAGATPADNQDPHDMALVKIEIKDNRNLVVEGHRFRLFEGGKRVEKMRETFKSKAADLENSQLWFSTTSGSDKNLHIAGWYNFQREEPAPDDSSAPNFSGGIWIKSFRGEFVEYQENPLAGRQAGTEQQGAAGLFMYQVGRLTLYGTRVPKSWRWGGPESSGEKLQDGGNDPSGFLQDIPNDDEVQKNIVKAGMRWWKATHAEMKRNSYLKADEADAIGRPDGHLKAGEASEAKPTR